MKLQAIISSISIYCLIFAISFFIPIIVALAYQEEYMVFYQCLLAILLIAGPIYIKNRKSSYEIQRIDSFLLVIFSWLTLCLIASIPFFKLVPGATFADAWFEAVSGLTTTGAEIFNTNEWPQSLKMYHQFLQFIGGLGIIVIGIALMPLMGSNPSNILDAEHTNSEQKITPRIKEAAKQIWKLYASMIILSVICYHIAGLPWFDAWSYGFSTFSTGGFGIYTDSIMHYRSQAVEMVACFFAIMGSLNFAIILSALRQRKVSKIYKFPETAVFFKFIATISAIVISMLVINRYQGNISSWIASVIMMITTTGLQTAKFAAWPSFLSHLMLFIAIIGGCSGSTTGGIKMHRIIVIKNDISSMFKQILHPRAVSSNRQKNNLIHGFIALNIVVYFIAIFIMIELGYNLETAFAGVTACLTNVGISIGAFSNNYHDASSTVKILLSILMLIGRLEATTILIIFSPFFWREI